MMWAKDSATAVMPRCKADFQQAEQVYQGFNDCVAAIGGDLDYCKTHMASRDVIARKYSLIEE